MRFWRGFVLLCVGVVCVLALPSPATAETWTVCSSGCDYTSIQVAIESANRGDTIELGAETFYENIIVHKGLTIRGAGPGLTIVDGSDGANVFYIGFDTWTQETVVLSGMTIQNGSGQGGGVRAGNLGRVTIDNCVIRDNEGEGIYTYPLDAYEDDEDDVVISNSLITGNTGGGVAASGSYYYGVPKVAIRSSVITDNTGPGVFKTDDAVVRVAIDGTTIAGNSAEGSAGGVYCGHNNWHGISISNSTIAYNDGAAFAAIGWCQADLTNVTLVGESGGLSLSSLEHTWCCDGHPMWCDEWCTQTNTPVVRFRGVLITSTGGLACSGDVPVISYGGNLSSDHSCALDLPGDTEGEDPLLTPLGAYGGPTPTCALQPDSPAIDAGGSACLLTDQRGVPRPIDGNGDTVALCDIGAVEHVPRCDEPGRTCEADRVGPFLVAP
jgi:hypothetical protein